MPINYIPNLFIVGQPKSGTSALHSFLDKHPQIFMSRPKELHFFCSDFHIESDKFYGRKIWYEFRNIENYLRIFNKANNKLILGESSINQLFSKKSAEEIYNFNPKAKIIIMLREPADFLHSLHNQYVNETAEDIEDFEKALEVEKDRKKGKNIPLRIRCPSYLYYVERIKYTEQIKRFLKLFPKNQIKIIIFDDFKKDNLKVYKEVLKFLKVNTNFVPEFKGVHESKQPKSKFLNSFFRNPYLKNIPKSIFSARIYDKIQLKVQAMLMKKQERKPLNPKLRKQLMKKFKPEVVKLSKLLKRDLVKEWGYDKIK